jgi:hypothetical protein
LRGVRQVVVEVERRSDENELGEVGADLPQPCSTSARPLQPTVQPSAAAVSPAPVAVPTSRAASPPSVTAPSAAEPDAERGRTWWLIPLLLIGGGLAVVGGVLFGRRSGRPD